MWERVADGTLSLELPEAPLQGVLLPRQVGTRREFGSLVVQRARRRRARPGGRASTSSTGLQNLADETGFAGDRNHVDMKIEWARMLGITDDELLGYRPMPETIGSVFTTLYYMRRSYEEGLAAFGWAGERFAASTNYAAMMYEGMRDHYGIEVENFKVHAYAEDDHGDAADYLLRQVAITAGQQRRIRRAVEHVLALPQRPHRGAQPLARRARRAAPLKSVTNWLLSSQFVTDLTNLAPQR